MLDVLKPLWVSIKRLFHQPMTVNYPLERREIPPRFRGGIFALSMNEQGELNCIACQLCQQICPSQIITVVKAFKEVEQEIVKPDGTKQVIKRKKTYPAEFIIDFNACMKCEMCVQVCPVDSIVMVPSVGDIALSREDLLLDIEKLKQNWLRYKMSAWATGETLRAEQDPKRTEPVDVSQKAKIPTAGKHPEKVNEGWKVKKII